MNPTGTDSFLTPETAPIWSRLYFYLMWSWDLLSELHDQSLVSLLRVLQDPHMRSSPWLNNSLSWLNALYSWDEVLQVPQVPKVLQVLLVQKALKLWPRWPLNIQKHWIPPKSSFCAFNLKFYTEGFRTHSTKLWRKHTNGFHNKSARELKLNRNSW